MRLAKLRQQLRGKSIDALVINSLPNIYYLSGFTSEDATLFITGDRSVLLTDFRYLEQAASEARDYEIIRLENNYFEVLKELTKGLTTIGIEEEHITWAEYRKMEKVLSGCTLLDSSSMLKDMRQVKDRAEIEIIRQAVKITDQAFAEIIRKIKPGMSEQEIELELEFSLRRKGASGKSFDFIVASGERSSLPHGTATEKIINSGELLTLDFGARYKWYCSDMTRTVCIGQPQAKHKEIYKIVLEAQQAALQVIKPGLRGKEVDAVARRVIAKYGYKDYFGHGLGHSVGLEIHESPRLSPRENKILEPGMIITVEPGIYIPDWGGVRIEDMVIVTKNGAEVLTQAPKQFIIIE